MKLDNARSRLLAAHDEMERQPHVYGESDCIVRIGWAAAAQLPEPKRSEILATMERYRGRYDTLSGAHRLLKQDGFKPLSLVKHFFVELEHQSQAEDGDIGAVKQGRDWSFGYFIGPHLYVSSPTGTAILPRSDAGKAFRVE